MSLLKPRSTWLLLPTLFIALLLLRILLLPTPLAANNPKDPVTSAWDIVRVAGTYHFSSDVTQVTLPTATVSNVGRAGRTEKLYLEGQNDLNTQKMELTLWADGGTRLDKASGTSIRSEHGKTYARRAGSEWKEIDDFTGSIAPQGDFLGYLSAIKDVQPLGEETRNGIAFSRYAFNIDSSRFAEYMHQQLEEAMRARGELPPGVQLQAPAYFRDMVGSGELWVGQDGLPLRQILTLQFPAQNDEELHSQIVVNFSEFGGGEVASSQPAVVSSQLLETIQLAPILAAISVFAFVALLITRRTRRVQTVVVVLVIGAQVAGPTLNSYLTRNYVNAQAAKVAAAKERQTEAKNDRELRQALGAVEFNPHLSPNHSIAQAPIANLSALPSPSISVPSAPSAPQADSGLDTDGDGLTDFAEERIGTSSVISDTDSDGLRDNIEVNGFSFGGQTWYTNPDATDTNGDGQVDVLEWGLNPDGSLRTTPLDTDSDGLPDLFDFDNDGDGVPDSKDLSPYTKGAAAYSDAAPLQLTLNNLIAGKPTFVEFQLRPQDEKQLWFAFNVLDWPQDSEGQVRDVDGKTYADVATAAGRIADVNEANGDMKVVPMLEIRIPAASANLPPQSDLTPFNISVNDFTADGQTKVALVPLSIVTDEKTGQRVAFSGQMRYLPTGIWNTPHQVRLSWVVNALVDFPCDKTVDLSADCQTDGVINNVPQVIQSYYGDWTLTGLTVREEHGTDMAMLYEDPTVDANKKDDAALWALAHVLDQHFVVAHDADNNNVRDLQLADFPTRFDRDNNPSASQRFDVPNILQVESRSYPTIDAAIAETTMTETVAILNNVFKSQVEGDREIKPLLMFAQENRSRLLGLDLSTVGSGYVTQAGSALTFDLAPSPATALTVDVNAGLKWMAYCAPATGTVTLTPCNDDDYWGTLDTRYGTLAPVVSDDNTEDWVGGRVMLSQLFFTGLRSGVYANVQTGAQIPAFRTRLETETETATAVRAVLQGLSTVPLVGAQSFYRLFPGYVPGDSPQIQKKATIGFAKVLRDGLKDAKDALADAAQSGGQKSHGHGIDSGKVLAKVKGKLASTKYLIFRFGAAIVGAAGAVLMVSLQIASLLPNLPHNTRQILGGLAIALNIAMNVVAPIVDVVRSLISSPLSAAKLLTFVGKSYAVVQRGAAIGAVLGVALIWGFFIYGAVSNGLAPGTPQFNRAAAEAIAATIVTVLLAVLAANPIGAIIGAILGVIDSILSLICELGVDELRKVNTLDGACFTLTGALTKALSKLIYNYDLMINLERDDLMVTGAPQVTLADPSKGYVVGNSLAITLPVTTTVTHKTPDPNNDVLIGPYLYFFSPDNLRSSSFKYGLTGTGIQNQPVVLNEMPTVWQNVRPDHLFRNATLYRGEMRTTPTVQNLPLQLGINTVVPFSLHMNYAIPAYECWLIVVYPYCTTRAYNGDNHMPINSLQYDVFPATLNAFLALGPKADGGAGQSWDAKFPSLRDADGDGLLSFAYNGMDPNDLTADADNDGLTDRFEMEDQSSGINTSPILRDTDNDGLTDLQERRLGTDPSKADSDNDGLKDGDEVYHLTVDPDTGVLSTTWAGGWDVQINATVPFTVRVSSDPLSADSDNDGLPDQTERQLALDANPANRIDSQGNPYHPNVPNTTLLAVVLETNDIDGYLAPGQSFRYSSTVIASAPVVSGVLNVQPATILGAAPNPLALAFNPLTFSVTQTSTLGLSLTVASGLGTQQTRITSTANTRLQNTGVAGWAFASIATEAPLGGIAAPNLPFYSAATANRPDRQDNFLLSTLAFQSIGSIGFGDILAYSIPSGTVRAIENDASNTAAILGNHPHRLATNASGDTLAVWDQQRYCNQITVNTLKVVTAGADSGDVVAGIEPLIALEPNGGSESTLWRWDQNAGTSMTSGQQRGPNAGGFPITAQYCDGPATLRVYDVDGVTNQLVATQLIDLYLPRNGVTFTLTGAGHVIEVNVTVPLRNAKVISGSLIGSDGQIKRAVAFPPSPVTTPYSAQSYAPVVASNGSGFLVAYESFAENTSGGNYGLPQVVVQAFDKDGNLLNTTFRDAGSAQAGRPGVDDLAIAIAWTGSSYRVIWQDRRASAIYLADASSDGQTLSQPQSFTQSGIVNAENTYSPGISYDPASGRTFIIYLGSTRDILGRVYAGNTLVAGPKVVSLAQFPAARSPQVVWHPNYRGWLLSYQDNTALQRHVFIPLDMNADPTFNPTTGFFIAANDNSLACPMPQSAPSVDLRFETLPNATAFTDSSGNNNTGTCSGATCPTAGFAGAPNAPLSDYAVQFDGVDDQLTLTRTITDDFSVAFWIKAPTIGGQQMIVDGGWPAANGFMIGLNNGGVLVRTPGINFQTARIDDNQWHFVVVSRNKASGRVDIFVDGNLAVGLSGTADVSVNAVANLTVGKRSNNTQPLSATLDNLSIYPATLLSDTVQAIFNRTQQSYCVAAGSSASNIYWAKVVANQQDTRGGRVAASNGLSLTIDGDLPSAQITAVQNGDIVAAGQIIGGSASDPTSGIGLVHVSINNSAWQTATGANTWAFSLAGYTDTLSLQVRATDNVGNVGNPSSAISLTIDNTAPVVTVNTPAGTIKPTQNVNGRWQVALSGSVSDAISGVNPDSVQVLLEQQSGTGVAQHQQQGVLNGTSWSVNYLLNEGLYDPTGAYTITVQAQDNIGNRAPPATTVARLDVRGPEAALNQSDLARQVISQTVTIGGVVSDTDSIVGIDTFEIAYTPIEQLAALPAGLTSDQAEALLNRTWAPVTLANRGAATSTWSVQIPADLENNYQVDMRGIDLLGNVAISSNLWRGMIDTTNPRVLMTATNTGISYFDAASNQRLYAIRFLCAAVDRNLDQKAFACPGAGIAQATRTFTGTQALQTLFPDLTIVNGLAISYTQWLPSNSSAITLRACDVFGRCATATSTNADTNAVDADTASTPQAVIAVPTNDSIVAASDTLSVSVVAEASASLKTVEIRLDNALVQTLSFSQSAAVTRTLRTIGLNNVSEGAHTLTANATDWANTVQTSTNPVTFIVDKAAPTVTIDASTLTNADTWQAQSGILRFNGTISDSVGLAAVQVRVDNGEFVDATFGDGTWHIAIFVPDPEGRTLSVAVRVIDQAGRITQITQSIGTNFSAAGLDTSITSTPANPSNVNSADIAFTGTVDAATFECQLDEQPYQPCASPSTHNDLSKGGHTFKVRAIDGSGAVDATPASFSWTVNTVQPEVLITAGPSTPSTSRSASFAFSGAADAVSFECALDGNTYSACSSPVIYSNLGNGAHRFGVRAKSSSNAYGTPTQFNWTVVNGAPVANNQRVVAVANSAKSIVLVATDGDPLVYKIVSGPSHGVLLGTAPNLTYVPDANFDRPDSFTFKADDGQLESNVATITVVFGDNNPIFLPLIYQAATAK